MKQKKLNHNYGYGTGIYNRDSVVKKLKLKNVNALKIYIEELFTSQLLNATIENGIVKMDSFPEVKLSIRQA